MHHHLAPLRLGVAPEEAKVLCVFAHGRTQTPEDMLEQVIGKLSLDGVCYLLPRAANNTWYAAKATEPLRDQTRAELEVSLAYIRRLLDEICAVAGKEKPLVIGGFSQGACLALEYAMKFGPWRGAMVSMTGCRVGLASDDRPFADLDRMPVYLSGSDKDPWIPVASFAAAAQALANARARLRCEVFPDRAHEACDREVAALRDVLAALAKGVTPFASS